MNNSSHRENSRLPFHILLPMYCKGSIILELIIQNQNFGGFTSLLNPKIRFLAVRLWVYVCVCVSIILKQITEEMLKLVVNICIAYT